MLLKLLTEKNTFLLLTTTALVTACASQPSLSGTQPPGFLLGLFHGFTILFSLIGSIFLDVRVYAYPNTGFLYDLGFFFGASSFLGAGGAGGARARNNS